MRKGEREFIAIIEEHGCVVMSMRHGRHYRVKVQTPAGEIKSITIPGSPGDWRSGKNFNQQIKRLVER